MFIRPSHRVAAMIGGCLLTIATSANAQSKVAQTPVSFELDVQPILTANGCNAGACHGKQRGQNGFQLSLLGFDPDFDFAALAKEARGRRVFPADPERSLLLAKATGSVPHGGGVRIDLGSPDYQVLLNWIAAGTPRQVEDEPTLERIELSASALSLSPGTTKPLIVTAHYSDGSQRDVTARTGYQSNQSAIVDVNDSGVVTAGPLPGEATIMARYMNLIGTCQVAIPLSGEVAAETYAGLPRKNFIDGLVWDKLQSLRITPSLPADDAKFMRRVYVDIIGRIPTAEEAREFLALTDPNKRQLLVDSLLARPEYADHWANKWVDLLRPNPYRVGIKAVLNYDHWIRDAFRKNKPYDQFVNELLTAQGSTFRNGAVTLYRDRRSPDEVATLVSQIFLGIRLECAKCHHHPFEKWSQEDFYSFAAYFARVGRKGGGVSPPISGSEEVVMIGKRGSVSHPLSGEVLDPRPLFGESAVTADNSDWRIPLANWITADENIYFRQVIVNRVWADLMGRGLVDPVDDLRATNPPSNGPLLVALADHFRDVNYDLKQLIRTMTLSHVYALSSLPSDRNVSDRRNYSRHYRTRLRAEVLLGAIDDITGVPTNFQAMPIGSRPNQIWTHRVGSLFLDTFGRPDPNKDPPCERLEESTVTQTLHLMNSPELYSKVTSDKGRMAALAASNHSIAEIVEELYLAIYGRFPTPDEFQFAETLFGREGTTRRKTIEDLAWSLMNTPEFFIKD